VSVLATDNANDAVLGDIALLRSLQLVASLPRWDSAATLDSNVRRVEYDLGYLVGCPVNQPKGFPMKARITFLAVILGAVLFALALGGTPWPDI
jgi:hypothetical protein